MREDPSDLLIEKRVCVEQISRRLSFQRSGVNQILSEDKSALTKTNCRPKVLRRDSLEHGEGADCPHQSRYLHYVGSDGTGG